MADFGTSDKLLTIQKPYYVHQNLLHGTKIEAGLHPEEQGPPLTECPKYARHASPCSINIVSFKPDGNLVRHELLLFPLHR